MEKHYRQGRVHCLQQEEYAALVCDFIERLPPQTVIQRVTGDPHPDELVAPGWALRKRETLERIRHIFRQRGSRQGDRFRSVF